jgi:hypothetical protein
VLALLAVAAAQEPLEYADPPLTLDPSTCRPAAGAAYLGLGSEAVVVVGHDDEGRCRIERFSEGEGAYTQLLCFVAADAPPAVWDPRGSGVPEPFPYRDACEVVDEGNLLLPDRDGERVPFPLGAGTGPIDDATP